MMGSKHVDKDVIDYPYLHGKVNKKWHYMNECHRDLIKMNESITCHTYLQCVVRKTYKTSHKYISTNLFSCCKPLTLYRDA
jgi:hypothetical protein